MNPWPLWQEDTVDRIQAREWGELSVISKLLIIILTTTFCTFVLHCFSSLHLYCAVKTLQCSPQFFSWPQKEEQKQETWHFDIFREEKCKKEEMFRINKESVKETSTTKQPPVAMTILTTLVKNKTSVCRYHILWQNLNCNDFSNNIYFHSLVIQWSSSSHKEFCTPKSVSTINKQLGL